MSAWYNENDPFAAAWLRELIKQNLIAPGEVDERSIREVRADDLKGFTQCHFFAGIGVWSYALRLAGWTDDRPVWTGSAPCPSFSCGGKAQGFDDPRHLWPIWARLIEVRKPPAIFGEQSAEAIGFGWLDLVQTDMERAGYAVGKAVFGACSVGAPHERKRLYFVGDCRWADTNSSNEHGRPEPFQMGRIRGAGKTKNLADTSRNIWASESRPPALAYGITNRMERLRGYGNAVVAQQAQAFIEAAMSTGAGG